MEFTQKKLPELAAQNLRSCLIKSVQPYAPMLAPVYVFMKRNGKFVSVKSPLDFFVPEELSRLSGFDSFYFPEFVDSVAPFQKAGRLARALLNWNPRQGEVLSPAPFELSDAILRLVGPLWSVSSDEELLIEPFFPIGFASELCDPIPQDILVRSREKSVEGYERALLCSAWTVFLAVHLGYCSLAVLNELRLKSFDDVLNESVPLGFLPGSQELEEIEFIAWSSLKKLDPVRASLFQSRQEMVARKILSRIKRITAEFAVPGKPAPTIFGDRGFVSV
ncbi:MAG TPA: hypothetical protein DCS07_10200 [Bdellovibrionales bacterium]|nr:MAG: hypothetical protein A2Z97_16165 [Bdellovibrionales bacterium GWB1_52_6]OFZ05012.1 MAG: hypothetical protein A2X97_00245 [Bdellovibrionales bacterium GWA1_52_35]OFZ35316.1 MAG: hypothetical protein A2070_10715 [Bdellovibrionales bacterium GWC1_52_8]HAR42981.1 hypothetical protein [Bdellovibrionales bacterium]HCM41244.1 hypothetical protein [Bdellovibrionales bacterium]